jgi:hypothetical protein
VFHCSAIFEAREDRESDKVIEPPFPSMRKTVHFQSGLMLLNTPRCFFTVHPSIRDLKRRRIEEKVQLLNNNNKFEKQRMGGQLQVTRCELGANCPLYSMIRYCTGIHGSLVFRRHAELDTTASASILYNVYHRMGQREGQGVESTSRGPEHNSRT